MSCAQPSIFAMTGCGGCGCVQAGAGRNVWSANTFIGATGPCYTIDDSNLAAWVAAYDFNSSVPWGNSLEGTFSSNGASPDSTTTWPSNYSPNPPSRGIINTPSGGTHYGGVQTVRWDFGIACPAKYMFLRVGIYQAATGDDCPEFVGPELQACCTGGGDASVWDDTEFDGYYPIDTGVQPASGPSYCGQCPQWTLLLFTLVGESTPDFDPPGAPFASMTDWIHQLTVTGTAGCIATGDTVGANTSALDLSQTCAAPCDEPFGGGAP